MAESTWETVAQPLLEAVANAESNEDVYYLTSKGLAEHLGLPRGQVEAELKRLHGSGHIGGRFESSGAAGGLDLHKPYLGAPGAQAIGRWPSSDPFGSLVQQLERAIDEAQTPEEKTKLRRLATVVGEVGQDVLTGVLTAWVKAGGGLS